ncbi:hypothetical protein BJV82DRAFT_673102 [Fennellomyces sp. T-0311]|nr:hypothetical protein BJV82DRAFT_673102 [Fennellomyces sp. T-0311]
MPIFNNNKVQVDVTGATGLLAENYDNDGASSIDFAANDKVEVSLEENENVSQGPRPELYLPGGKPPKKDVKEMLKPFLNIILLLVVNVGIPLGIYYGLRGIIGDTWALIVSGAPSFLWVLWGIIKHRKVDLLSAIIGISFILSGVLSVINGDVKAVIIRDSAVGAVIGLMFLITLIPLKTKWMYLRPLTFMMVAEMYINSKYSWVDRYGNIQTQPIMEWQWENIRYYRVSMYMQTAAWGTLLILELVLCILLVELSSLEPVQIIMFNFILQGAIFVTMIIVIIIAAIPMAKKEKRIGKAWCEVNDCSEKFYGPAPEDEDDKKKRLKKEAKEQKKHLKLQQKMNQNDRYDPPRTDNIV